MWWNDPSARQPIGPLVAAIKRNHKLLTKLFIYFVRHRRKLSIQAVASEPLNAGVARYHTYVARLSRTLDHSRFFSLATEVPKY